MSSRQGRAARRSRRGFTPDKLPLRSFTLDKLLLRSFTPDNLLYSKSFTFESKECGVERKMWRTARRSKRCFTVMLIISPRDAHHHIDINGIPWEESRRKYVI